VRLAAQAPVLVQLPDRQFGASAVLQSHLIPSHAGTASYTHIFITERGSVRCRIRSNLPLHLPVIISPGCRADVRMKRMYVQAVQNGYLLSGMRLQPTMLQQTGLQTL